MSRALLALLLAASAFSTSPQLTTDASARALYQDVNVSTVLNAVGAPLCMRRCSHRLTDAVKQMLSFNGTMNKLDSLCNIFEKSKKCIHRRKACGPTDVFDAVTSGIEYACVTKRDSFEKAAPCLAGKIDQLLIDCDKECSIRAALASLSTADTTQIAANMGGNLVLVADGLPPFCNATRCMLPCVTRRANAACPLSGSLFVDSMVQPFDRAARLLSNASSFVQKMVRQKLSSDCTFLVDMESLEQLRRGLFH